MRDEPIKVLFIAGYGRSGSTLLDRVLGRVEGFHSIGELRHVFLEGYVEDRRCGCGERFRACPFWDEVTERAFGGHSEVDPEDVLDLQRRVDRWWRVPQLASGAGSRRRADELERYRDVLRRIYAAIAAVSGARVIVDSSKDVSHGYVLRGVNPPIEPYFLHLVRDSRAVAHSWRRRKYNPGNDADMRRYSLLRTCAEWNAINALTRAHRRIDRDRYHLLRYSEFADDPGRAVEGVLDFLGETDVPQPFDEPDAIELGPDHTAAGNPSRFRTGRVAVRPDEEWRAKMPVAARALVSALTLPSLVRYR